MLPFIYSLLAQVLWFIVSAYSPQSHSRAYAHGVSKLACMDAGKGREQDAVALTALLTGM